MNLTDVEAIEWLAHFDLPYSFTSQCTITPIILESAAVFQQS